MKRIAIVGCKSTTQFMLKSLYRQLPISHCITISPEQGARHEVADYCDLEETSRHLGIERYGAYKYSLKDPRDLNQIAQMKLDLAFVIGWQRLIPAEILAHISIGVFGMHGSSMNLPLGRGRSPMNWSLIEDRRFFYTNLFKYDAGVDSGDVLDTFVFSISAHDDAQTMHFKNTLAMKHLMLKNAERLLSGDFVLKRQPDKAPTYYPKRNPSDGLLDWGRDIFYLERFIRAVTRPFNGAYTYVRRHRLTVYRSQIFETDVVDFGYGELPTASVVEVLPGERILIRCNGGLLLVHEYTCEIPIELGMCFDSGPEQIRRFPFNQHGYYDLEE